MRELEQVGEMRVFPTCASYPVQAKQVFCRKGGAEGKCRFYIRQRPLEERYEVLVLSDRWAGTECRIPVDFARGRE